MYQPASEGTESATPATTRTLIGAVGLFIEGEFFDRRIERAAGADAQVGVRQMSAAEINLQTPC
jgi:hypothetical protein